MTGRTRGAGLLALVTIAAALTALTGCDNFFVPEPTTGGGGGSTTNNYVYVANSTTNSIAGFTIGTGTLTAVSGSPLALNYAPLAAVVTPSNSFLYVAGGGAINVYAINSSNGSLTSASGGAVVNVVALDVSPDGAWLFGLDSTSNAVDQFQINTSTGALSTAPQTPYSVSGTVVPSDIRVAPSGAYVFAAVGTGGDAIFTFNTTSGALVQVANIQMDDVTTSENALAVDSTSTHLYTARSGTSGGVGVYTINPGGVLNAVSGSPFTAGNNPRSVVLDKTGKYVYVANRGDGTISGYSIGTSFTLSALSGSPYLSGTQVNSLGVDKTGTYLLATAFGGSPDLSMYTFDATNLGKLNISTTTSTGSGTNGAIALALTPR